MAAGRPPVDGGWRYGWAASALSAMSLGGVSLQAHAELVGRSAVHARLDHHDDAVPLRAHGDDDEVLRRLEPRPGRNRAWIDDELRVSHDTGHWSIGLLARSRLDVRVDADTLDLVRHVDRDEAVPSSGRRWQVDARATGFAGRGLLIGRAMSDMPACVCSAWGELQGLQLTRWIERRWSGQVDRDGTDGRYALSLQSWRRDDRQTDYFLSPPAGHGQALLLAGGFRWAMRPGWQLTGSVHDLGRLRWRGIVEEQATVSTDTELRDAEGLITLAPLMQGSVRARTSTTRAPAWVQLRLDARVTASGSGSFATRWGASGQGWRQFAWREALSPDHALVVLAHSPGWPVRRWGLEILDGTGACDGWSLGIAADRLSGQRRSAGLTLGWRHCG